MTQTWMNNDGLYLKFGTDKAVTNKAGEYVTHGALREIEVKIPVMTSVASTATIISDQTWIPAGVRLQEVEVVCDTVVTGSSSTLNIGLVKSDRTTEIDFDGILAAFPLTSMDAAGEKTVVVVGGTGAGAKLGTTTAFTGYITADYDTAAFTAGAITLRIRYYKV